MANAFCASSRSPRLRMGRSDFLTSWTPMSEKPRELDLLSEMRMLDPIPPRLMEAIRGKGLSAIEVSDTSPLSLAASAGEAAGFLRTIENVRELVNVTQD